MSGYYFSAEAMSVGYQGKPLIKNINIAIQKGEIVTLIGPNGAGKSTILKSIARQLELLGGMVFLDGNSLMQISRKTLAQQMAVMLTDKVRTEMMTCRDVVAAGRYPYTGRFGMLTERDLEIVEEAMTLVHVADLQDQDFSKISDGQKQRVLLARAICQQPQIIILDEPTSYLDVRYKLEFLSVLQGLCKQKGMTVIMSLHELELAERISDRLICIKGDKVDRFGTPGEVFVQGYIRRLYEISAGSYDEENGMLELEPPKGSADVFVIAGGGTGRMVYRRLQKEGKAFMTGILYPYDLDFPVARALAAEVVTAESFEPVPVSLLEQAKSRLAFCHTVICCKETFGSLEQYNQELLDFAKEIGKTIESAGNICQKSL